MRDQHNPNCPSPFEVRTCGSAFMVDPKEPRNFVSYGKTLEEAMESAVIKIENEERRKYVRREQEPFARIVWA